VRVDSNIALLVAVSGLKAVDSVISAMRAADAAGKSSGGPLGLGPTVNPRNQTHPDPRFETRMVISPTPLYEPRQVIHPTPRIEMQNLAADRSSPPREIVVDKTPSELPLQPPWKTVPWKNSLPPATKVKLTRPHPDICHKGLLLDYFL
jgi:hypothetical protein